MRSEAEVGLKNFSGCRSRRRRGRLRGPGAMRSEGCAAASLATGGASAAGSSLGLRVRTGPRGGPVWQVRRQSALCVGNLCRSSKGGTSAFDSGGRFRRGCVRSPSHRIEKAIDLSLEESGRTLLVPKDKNLTARSFAPAAVALRFVARRARDSCRAPPDGRVAKDASQATQRVKSNQFSSDFSKRRGTSTAHEAAPSDREDRTADPEDKGMRKIFQPNTFRIIRKRRPLGQRRPIEGRRPWHQRQPTRSAS